MNNKIIDALEILGFSGKGISDLKNFHAVEHVKRKIKIAYFQAISDSIFRSNQKRGATEKKS
jgi:hypothetical protein